MTDQPKTEKGGTTDHDHETVRLPLLQSLLKSWTGPEYGLGEIAQATPWAAAIFAIQVLKGAAPIIIVVGIGIYGASFIERSIVESRNSALTLITETRKEARNDLDNQIKAFNDMTTATSAQIANIAKMQDLQQQVSSQLNAATDARLAAQKAEQDALTKKREAEDQVRSLEAHESPHFQMVPKRRANTGCWRSRAAKPCMRGRRRMSGMVGMSS
jgi:uncharacterized protein (UPF0333 family)